MDRDRETLEERVREAEKRAHDVELREKKIMKKTTELGDVVRKLEDESRDVVVELEKPKGTLKGEKELTGVAKGKVRRLTEENARMLKEKVELHVEVDKRLTRGLKMWHAPSVWGIRITLIVFSRLGLTSRAIRLMTAVPIWPRQ